MSLCENHWISIFIFFFYLFLNLQFIGIMLSIHFHWKKYFHSISDVDIYAMLTTIDGTRLKNGSAEENDVHNIDERFDSIECRTVMFNIFNDNNKQRIILCKSIFDAMMTCVRFTRFFFVHSFHISLYHFMTVSQIIHGLSFFYSSAIKMAIVACVCTLVLVSFFHSALLLLHILFLYLFTV